jgi:flagellar basal body-associated protein FliL
MNNYMKNVTYNQAQADVTQTAKIKGMFSGLIGFIFGIIALIIIGVIILFVIGAIGYTGVKVTKKATASKPVQPAQPQPTLQQQVLKQLLLSS